ncbi:MAG: hypothetical protein LBT00_01300 [Spirochaetaceae bacterium]|nr:hypothetical protein [Spirochaetaceae bacterium]
MKKEMKMCSIQGKGKMIVAIAFVYLVVLGVSVFAMGSTQSGSGEYKQFNYQDGGINRSVRSEYIGYYLKEFSIKANGTVLVVKGNFRPWNGEFTGWEDLGEERIPYGNTLDSRYVLEGAAEGVSFINVTQINGSTVILEATPDNNGNYWWWTTNGTIQFFQNVWVVH